MLVRVDVSPAIQKRAGVGRYCDGLVRALVSLPTDWSIELFYTDSRGRTPSVPLDALPRTAMRWPNKLWRMAALLSWYTHVPMNSRVGETSVFHATDHILPRLRGTRSVFTLHDLSFLTHSETHLSSNSWFLKLAVPVFLRRADAVICVSEHTRRDAVRCYGLDESKTYVVAEGVESQFRPIASADTIAAVRTRYRLPERFILFVGTIEPRKNLVTLLEAYSVLRKEGRTERLVVVGRKGWLHDGVFSRLRDLGLQDEVLFPGFVDDEDLPSLYSAASVFVFPSLYEGFGLPPLEAMACGTPVVCSDAASLPEVCGDAAILFPPQDVSKLAEALRRTLDDTVLWQELRGRGIRQAARFTWRSTAERTLAVYQAAKERGVGGQLTRHRQATRQ